MQFDKTARNLVFRLDFFFFLLYDKNTNQIYDETRNIMLEFLPVNETNVVILGEVHSKAWQASHKGIASERYWNTITPKRQTEYFQSQMQNPDNHYFLICQAKTPIGMISLNHSADSDAGEIMQLYFLPEYCGKGYGKKAMDFGIAYLQKHGVRTIKLWVMNINERAKRFYQSCGFSYTGIEKELDPSRNLTEQCYARNLVDDCDTITYHNTLSPQEFNALRKCVGWYEFNEARAKLGLEHTAFISVARADGKAIGMARVVTDYGYFAYIGDVIVHPDYQRRGIGTKLMTNVMDYIKDKLANGQNMMVVLVSAKGKEEFYEKFGFVKRPNEQNGCGMSQTIFSI